MLKSYYASSVRGLSFSQPVHNNILTLTIIMIIIMIIIFDHVAKECLQLIKELARFKVQCWAFKFEGNFFKHFMCMEHKNWKKKNKLSESRYK